MPPTDLKLTIRQSKWQSSLHVKGTDVKGQEISQFISSLSCTNGGKDIFCGEPAFNEVENIFNYFFSVDSIHIGACN